LIRIPELFLFVLGHPVVNRYFRLVLFPTHIVKKHRDVSTSRNIEWRYITVGRFLPPSITFHHHQQQQPCPNSVCISAITDGWRISNDVSGFSVLLWTHHVPLMVSICKLMAPKLPQSRSAPLPYNSALRL